MARKLDPSTCDFSGEGVTASSKGEYRYAEWLPTGVESQRACCIIGLIPSLPSWSKAQQLRATCLRVAKEHEFGKLILVNLFAAMHQDSVSLPVIADPVGPDNDRWILAAAQSEIVIAAWGDFPGTQARARHILRLLERVDVHCVQNNKNGTPTHPLAWRLRSPKIYRRSVTPSLPAAG